MAYLDPVDSQTMKKIGINVVALVGLTLCLVAIVAALT
jgi:hypothetical protein